MKLDAMVIEEETGFSRIGMRLEPDCLRQAKAQKVVSLLAYPSAKADGNLKNLESDFIYLLFSPSRGEKIVKLNKIFNYCRWL